jgi:hypothetical protein
MNTDCVGGISHINQTIVHLEAAAPKAGAAREVAAKRTEAVKRQRAAKRTRAAKRSGGKRF